ncbi:sn-glycerol-3-phosphate transporter [Marinospirillum insulare]|uniref:Sn-glycerol-3-phosphate transporter n=1 Tax=Marinospirillum insulare TaxID=217169 RepID=A0ABQ5ZWU8_9GAMM|nr:sn-glycerol-3-phosphate transporter [Marinospirillum insulare]GLR63803.1 hypothetical protein GCM10007878_12380 [Marinospirillum insulare]
MNFSKAGVLVLLVACLPSITSAKQVEPAENNLIQKIFQPVPSEAYWYLQTSIGTKHFNPKPEHNNRQKLFSVERNRDDSYLWGGATFLNSFKQRTYYAYLGKRYDFGESPFCGKLTAGFLHGYKGEYRDKIPLNRYKTAPAILPSLGVQYKRLHLEGILAGSAAMMINAGIRL